MTITIRQLSMSALTLGLLLATGPGQAHPDAVEGGGIKNLEKRLHDLRRHGASDWRHRQRIKALEMRLHDLEGEVEAIELTPGPQGEAGPPGPAGPQGPSGPQGPAGGSAVVVDADGVVLGTPLSWNLGEGAETQVITDTGYVADIDRQSGLLSGTFLFDLYFESADCTGQALIPSAEVENVDTGEFETLDSALLRGTVARAPSEREVAHLAATYYVPRDAVSMGPFEAHSALFADFGHEPPIIVCSTTDTPRGDDLPRTLDSAVPAFENVPEDTGIPDAIVAPLSIGLR